MSLTDPAAVLFLSPDFCSSSSSSSSPPFQPVRSVTSIPTAHVMPSTAATAPQTAPQDHTRSSSSSGSGTPAVTGGTASRSSALAKSASSPDLDGQQAAAAAVARPDCLSRYRSLVNGLDRSLLPPEDGGQRFDTPAMEPTLNQSALLGSLCPDLRLQRMQRDAAPPCSGAESYRENSYKVLPEARSGLLEPSNQRAGFASAHSSPLSLQTQALLREHSAPKGLDGLRQDRGGDISSWQQQQQHKQQLDSLRLQMEQMQVSPIRSIWFRLGQARLINVRSGLGHGGFGWVVSRSGVVSTNQF